MYLLITVQRYYFFEKMPLFNLFELQATWVISKKVLKIIHFFVLHWEIADIYLVVNCKRRTMKSEIER